MPGISSHWQRQHKYQEINESNHWCRDNCIVGVQLLDCSQGLVSWYKKSLHAVCQHKHGYNWSVFHLGSWRNFTEKSQLLAGGLSIEHRGNQLLVREKVRGRICRMQWSNHTKQCKPEMDHGNFQNLKFQPNLNKILRNFKKFTSITEYFEKTSGDHLVQPPCSKQLTREGCSGTFSIKILILPEVEAIQALWTTCFSVWDV